MKKFNTRKIILNCVIALFVGFILLVVSTVDSFFNYKPAEHLRYLESKKGDYEKLYLNNAEVLDDLSALSNSIELGKEVYFSFSKSNELKYGVYTVDRVDVTNEYIEANGSRFFDLQKNKLEQLSKSSNKSIERIEVTLNSVVVVFRSGMMSLAAITTKPRWLDEDSSHKLYKINATWYIEFFVSPNR